MCDNNYKKGGSCRYSHRIDFTLSSSVSLLYSSWPCDHKQCLLSQQGSDYDAIYVALMLDKKFHDKQVWIGENLKVHGSSPGID